MQLVFFGDSVCRGYGAPPGRGWVEQLARRLEIRFPDIRVRNAGVDGDITTEALGRMARDVEAVHPDLVYVQFGLNDCSWWCRQPGRPWVEPDRYAANLRCIAERALNCGARIVIAGAGHLPADNNGNAPETSDFAAMSRTRRTALYNNILRESLGGMPGVRIADVEREMPAGVSPTLPDGLHLNETGNTLYADIVGRVIFEWLEEAVS